jgi:hypothetical protein
MRAFSNLFRFANPKQPMQMPNQEDAIFIPYIPRKFIQQADPVPEPTETEKMVDFDFSHHVCNSCSYKFDSTKEHYTLIILPGKTSTYLCHSCNLGRDKSPDEIKIISDD